MKPTRINEAKKVFAGTNINITTEGRRYLGGVIGSEEFKQEFVDREIQVLIEQLKRLSQIALFEPQAAYSGFLFGFKHKITYLMRSVPDISESLRKLDEVISTTFIPAITGGVNCSNLERNLLTLPPKQGGMGIPIFSKNSNFEFKSSLTTTEKLKDNIKSQTPRYEIDPNATKVKQNIKNQRKQEQNTMLQKVRAEMTEQQRKLNSLACEKHASLWLTTLPLKNEGYALTKQQFWDLIRIRYGWQLKRLPVNCECGSSFTVDHAMSCKKGGFISLRHNHLRNITANLLSECCKDTSLEPMLQPLTGETLPPSSNISDEARLDIAARGFWESHQLAFFDIRALVHIPFS